MGSATGITEFFGGLGQHLGQQVRNERAADALAVGDRVRYHGSLERHHGEGVLREVGRVCRVHLDSGREVDCNATSVTKVVARVAVSAEIVERTTTAMLGRERRITVTHSDGTTETRWHSEWEQCSVCRAFDAHPYSRVVQLS